MEGPISLKINLKFLLFLVDNLISYEMFLSGLSLHLQFYVSIV